jgi:DMSO reductase family type II enzyme chaperone
MQPSAIDRAFARANLYRFLSLAFAYPTADLFRELREGLIPARVAAETLSPELGALTERAAAALQERDRPLLASEYRKTFSFSASPDCPLYECAYSAKHVYQEVQSLADLAGFYTAFGLEIAGERPDGLAAELEFAALLALKEGVAREKGLKPEAGVCREGSRLFLREHLARWAGNIGRRIELLAAGRAYEHLGRLLAAFASHEIEALKLGPIDFYQETPNPPQPPDDGSCPAEEGLGATALDLQAGEALLGLADAGPARGGA